MRRRTSHSWGSIAYELLFLVASIAATIFLARAGIAHRVALVADGSAPWGSFVSGIFFVSLFTAAPATLLLAEISRVHSIFLTACFGALGALVGDYLLFRFIRDKLSARLVAVAHNVRIRKMMLFTQAPVFRWIVPVVGAFIVMSPLPDEIGLMMMGLSGMRTSTFIPLSFALNFIGILAIGFGARSLLP